MTMPRPSAFYALAPLLAIALTGCAGGGSSTTASSGVRGTVLIGPTCAAQRVGQDCADKPYAAELRVVDPASNQQVATLSSGANGRFEVALSPGRYRIESGSSKSLPRAEPVEVTVPPHRYVNVMLRFDSGIR
jgi:hypothetical protein